MARWDRGGTESSSVPDWFWAAVETPSEEHAVEVEDCDVVFRTWGDTAKPPMLLIHGMNAHSRWWDFIAPQLTDEYRLAAMDLTGMGDSDYRYGYDADTYGKEIVAVCDAAGFATDVIVVGHSFGGMMAAKAANIYPDRFGSLILVDSGIRHPDEPVPDGPMMGGGRAKAYPDRATAEARFRLFPPQPCANEYILTYIAKQSLMRLDGGAWAWKFDEELPLTLKGGERQPEDYTGLTLPVGIIYGENSSSFTKSTLDYTLELIPGDVEVAGIDDAQHHVFLDQPLAFIAALRRIAATIAPAKRLANGTMPDQVRLRIVLIEPPAGYAFCLQSGKGAKAERVDYVEAADEDIAFEFEVAVRKAKRGGLPDFGGPLVQGPPGGRFIYICVGRCSMIAEPHWAGRVKVALKTITWPAVRRAASEDRVLEARYVASRENGQPAFASVKLLDDGWSVR